MSAVTLLAEATLKAAVHIKIEKKLDIDAETLSEALKTTIKGNLDEVMTDWKEALEANLGNTWLQELMKVQAVELAQKSIELALIN
jgi:uncharacterized protein YqgV (UPF0045/DUF77 family)